MLSIVLKKLLRDFPFEKCAFRYISKIISFVLIPFINYFGHYLIFCENIVLFISKFFNYFSKKNNSKFIFLKHQFSGVKIHFFFPYSTKIFFVK